MSDPVAPLVFLDRERHPLRGARDWLLLFQDESYRIIAHDRRTGVRVLTVWLGLDVREPPGDGVPLIFRTQSKRAGRLLGEWFWATEQAARAGHAEVLAGLGAGWREWRA